MSFVKLNFEGKSVEDLIRIRAKLYTQPDNEYCLQVAQIITNILRDMDDSESEIETDSDIETESESETESEIETDIESE